MDENPANIVLGSAESALAALRRGHMVVVVDDESREDEGDLVIAAEWADARAINFMATYGRGLICLALTEERAAELRLVDQRASGQTARRTRFTESIEAVSGITTGISAQDRARTIQVAIDPASSCADLAKPGHIFPLRARAGGVLARPGHTEAAVDLARLAGMRPAGVICEIMAEDGSMARRPQLEEFCLRHGLHLLRIGDLITYRLNAERVLRKIWDGPLTTKEGTFRLLQFAPYTSREAVDEGEAAAPHHAQRHLVLTMGAVEDGEEACLLRIQEHCTSGHIFGSIDCDCHMLLRRAMSRIAEQGRGILVYIDRSIPISIETTPVHRGSGTEDSPMRSEARLQRNQLTGQLLQELGVSRVHLLSDRASAKFQCPGIEIVGYSSLNEGESVTPG